MPVSKLFFLELGLCHSGHSMNPLFSSVHVMSFSGKAPVVGIYNDRSKFSAGKLRLTGRHYLHYHCFDLFFFSLKD